MIDVVVNLVLLVVALVVIGGVASQAIRVVREYRRLRAVIGDIVLDDVLARREQMNQDLRRKLDEVTERWGVKVTVEIGEVVPPKDVQDAMNRQMSAERTRRAAVREAEGKRQATITVAEGDSNRKSCAPKGSDRVRPSKPKATGRRCKLFDTPGHRWAQGARRQPQQHFHHPDGVHALAWPDRPVSRPECRWCEYSWPAGPERQRRDRHPFAAELATLRGQSSSRWRPWAMARIAHPRSERFETAGFHSATFDLDEGAIPVVADVLDANACRARYTAVSSPG